MKVWVVASDIGLNGVIVHGVYSEPPGDEVDRFVYQKDPVNRVSSYGGYQGTEVLEFELDGDLR